MHLCEVRSEYDVDSLLSSEGYWHVYLFIHNESREKQRFEIRTFVKY